MNKSTYIIRHTKPTRFDEAPFGTVCQISGDENQCEIFVQMSKTNIPQWEPIGFLLECAFVEKLNDMDFIEELFNLIDPIEEKSYKKLISLLQ